MFGVIAAVEQNVGMGWKIEVLSFRVSDPFNVLEEGVLFGVFEDKLSSL
jgi:hypothetical protein